MQTVSQTEFVWSCYVDRNKLGQMGPIKGEGTHGEVSLSLFIVELERWALILHLLISLDPTDGFASCDLQVKALPEPLHFDGLFTKFDHLVAPHELFGVSCAPGHSFRRERCALGAPVGQL